MIMGNPVINQPWEDLEPLNMGDDVPQLVPSGFSTIHQ